jgi:hypothetical protein
MYALGTWLLARNFPAVNSDEVVRTVIAQHVVHGEPSRYSLYDDIFARPVYMMRDVIPETSIIIYHAWLGTWARWHGFDYMSCRVSSIAAGALELLMFYAMGVSLGGPRFGMWNMALVGSSPLFLSVSCIARPENLLLLTSTAVLWLALRVPEKIATKPFFVGTLATIQMGIHPNASVIGAGLFVFYVLGLPRETRFPKASLFVGGAVAGLIAVLLLIDLKRFWLGMHTVHSYLLRPPIFTAPFNPWDWLTQTLRVMGTGQTYYLAGSTSAPAWRLSVAIWWIAVAAVGIFSSMRRRDAVAPLYRWWAACLTMFVATIALVKAKESLYGTNFFPFLVPAISSALMGFESPRSRWIKIGTGALLGCSFFLFTAFCKQYTGRHKPYSQVIRELRAVLPAEPLKVAGPSVLWFDWNRNLFRDDGALMVSRWYMGGQWDVQSWLEPWHPDILIVDATLQNLFQQSQWDADTLAPYLSRPAELLATLDTETYGKWMVYRLHWS